MKFFLLFLNLISIGSIRTKTFWDQPECQCWNHDFGGDQPVDGRVLNSDLVTDYLSFFPFIGTFYIALTKEIVKSYFHECMGTLISESFVLTSAECVDFIELEFKPNFKFGLGDVDISKIILYDKYTSKLERTFKHPLYTPPITGKEDMAHRNNLGLVQLSRTFNLTGLFDIFQVACLYTGVKFDHSNEEYYVAGWGKANVSDGSTPEIPFKYSGGLATIQVAEEKLRYIKIKYDSGYIRFKEHETWIRIDYSSYIYGGKIKTTCFNDAGAPLIRFDKATKRLEVIAISNQTPFGRDLSCGKRYDDKFTSIWPKENSDWINDMVSKYNTCQIPQLLQNPDEYCSSCHHTPYNFTYKFKWPYWSERIFNGKTYLANNVNFSLSYVAAILLEETRTDWPSGDLVGKFWPICTGTILNSLWVMTAGHCARTVQNDLNDNSTIKVAAGFDGNLSHILLTNDNVRVVNLGAASWKWEDPRDFATDIGLLRLETPFYFGPALNIYPACLNTRGAILSNHLIIAGYGYTDNTLEGRSTDRQKFELNATTSTLQFEVFEYAGTFDDVGMTKKSTSYSTCKGDSGAPVIELASDGKAYVVGVHVASFPDGCDGTSKESVFSLVSVNMDFLTQVIGRDLCWIPLIPSHHPN